MHLQLKDSFNKELPADSSRENKSRQVLASCFSYVQPQKPAAPKLIHASDEVACMLGIGEEDLKSDAFLNIVSGNEIIEGNEPYAMCYGGHQFGHWAGQLGDGRAINLGEVVHDNKVWALQLKGAGRTPYSRSADGLAVLRSSIREHLCSEAMHHLGVPTTRSLSLSLSGDQVMRDMLYDGHPAYEKGAIVCRVAQSFIRFGNFQIFASREDLTNLKLLTDYTIKHFFPQIVSEGKDAYVEFFKIVSKSTLKMILHWERVGFVHGVMNTDNMSILGLTIDYGPYGWLDDYNPDWTPNTTDRQHKRYRYGQQAPIAHWNLFQLANALYPLVQETKDLEEILNAFQSDYLAERHMMMKAKLGLEKDVEGDVALFAELEKTLLLTETDMTIFYRLLGNVTREGSDLLKLIEPAFYRPTEVEAGIATTWKEFLGKYQIRLKNETLNDEERKRKMNLQNPKYVLRNYMAQLAIDAAEKEDYSILRELFKLLKNPYAEQVENEKWFAKRPDWARHKVGCSMLSCSS